MRNINDPITGGAAACPEKENARRGGRAQESKSAIQKKNSAINYAAFCYWLQEAVAMFVLLAVSWGLFAIAEVLQ